MFILMNKIDTFVVNCKRRTELRMTREEAIKIIKQRIETDNQLVQNQKIMSDFDKFITEQDEALSVAIEFMENPVKNLTYLELYEAFRAQQYIYDRQDIEEGIAFRYDEFIERFSIDKNPVTEEELNSMTALLREMLDFDGDSDWNSCCSQAIVKILKERKCMTSGR